MSKPWSLSSMHLRNPDDAVALTRFLVETYTLVDAAFYRWLKRANLTRTHISVLHLRYDESPRASREQWSLREVMKKKYPRHKRFQGFLDDIVNEGNNLIDMTDYDSGNPQKEQVFRQSVAAFVKRLNDLIEQVRLPK